MSHDPQNPVSNETGEYLQEVAEHKSVKSVEVTEEKKPAKASRRK